MQLPAHGANARSLYEKLSLSIPERIIDLSENVNVLGVPKRIEQMWPSLFSKIQAYPNEEAEPFRSATASFHQVVKEHVVVGNGAAEILMALAQLFQKKRVIVLDPSFSEYRRTLAQQGAQVVSIVVDEIESYTLPMERIKEEMEQADALYICNPNNPTGVLLARVQIEQLLQHAEKVNCAIVVDEAFIDWTDESESVVPLIAQYEQLFVVRSMTKMYALAGVRLGYVISQQAERIKHYLPHWSVSQIAIEIGVQCLQEHEFVSASRQQSEAMKQLVVPFLRQKGCLVTNGRANYVTFKPPAHIEPKALYVDLLKQGIVLRHTENFIGLDGKWFRIGMKDERAMKEFMRAFESFERDSFIRSQTRRNEVE